VQIVAALAGLDPVEDWAVNIPLYLGYLSIPVATGFAVLRYRLYDVDVILSRALVLVALLAFVTAGYVAIVVLIGAFVGRQAGAAFWPSLLATALVALAFQPLRRRVGRWADRVAYGERALPYEALAEFTRTLESSLSTAELLPRVAEAAARTVNASASVVTLAVPGGADVRVTWPPGDDVDATVRDDAVRRVTHAGTELGTIAVAVPSGRPLRREEARLLDDLAVQAALPFLNARLFAALEQRSQQLVADAAAVEASRHRLVVAANAERRRLARSINREVLPYLAPVPDRLDALEELSTSIGSALDALRRISKGVFPPALGRKGLVPALRAHLASGGHVLEVDGMPEGRRFGSQVEAAAYFCCVEAARDLAAPVRCAVALDDVALWLTVEGTRRDDAELEADLQLVSDRVAAVHGQVDVWSDGPLVRVTARIPVDRAAERHGERALGASAVGGAGSGADVAAR
jgi:signal transduction histidine kinase